MKGFLTLSDLEQVLDAVGLKELRKHDFQDFLQQMFQDIDINGDGILTYDEFVEFYNDFMESLDHHK